LAGAAIQRGLETGLVANSAMVEVYVHFQGRLTLILLLPIIVNVRVTWLTGPVYGATARVTRSPNTGMLLVVPTTTGRVPYVPGSMGASRAGAGSASSPTGASIVTVLMTAASCPVANASSLLTQVPSVLLKFVPAGQRDLLGLLGLLVRATLGSVVEGSRGTAVGSAASDGSCCGVLSRVGGLEVWCSLRLREPAEPHKGQKVSLKVGNDDGVGGRDDDPLSCSSSC